MSFIKLFEEFVQKKDIDTKSKLSAFLSEDEQPAPEPEPEQQEDDGGVSIYDFNVC